MTSVCPSWRQGRESSCIPSESISHRSSCYSMVRYPVNQRFHSSLCTSSDRGAPIYTRTPSTGGAPTGSNCHLLFPQDQDCLSAFSWLARINQLAGGFVSHAQPIYLARLTRVSLKSKSGSRSYTKVLFSALPCAILYIDLLHCCYVGLYVKTVNNRNNYIVTVAWPWHDGMVEIFLLTLFSIVSEHWGRSTISFALLLTLKIAFKY